MSSYYTIRSVLTGWYLPIRWTEGVPSSPAGPFEAPWLFRNKERAEAEMNDYLSSAPRPDRREDKLEVVQVFIEEA